MIALLDCNNFYCSCERVFRPELEKKPVAVLSNNDGCIIARSQEVKALGIPMGAPMFKYKPIIEKEGIHIFSANFALYGDMSERVMSTLKEFAPAVEVYSIDESFVDLSGFKLSELVPFCRELRATIRQWTGIPVSIGIAPTKTLAKLANKIAKKRTDSGGVYALADKAGYQYELSQCGIGEVWGIGGRLTERINAKGIETAWQLSQVEPQWARDEVGVVLERTVRELRGISCIPLELAADYRQRIMVSRSFGHDVNDIQELKAAVTTFAARAGEKLRRQNCRASSISVFAHTNPFKENQKQYKGSVIVRFDYPTQDTRVLIDAANQGLESLFRKGYFYKKAGVMLDDILPESVCQLNLFAEDFKQSALSKSIDQINARMGAGAVRFAAMDIGRNWRMNQQSRSPKYTTNWKDLPIIL